MTDFHRVSLVPTMQTPHPRAQQSRVTRVVVTLSLCAVTSITGLANAAEADAQTAELDLGWLPPSGGFLELGIESGLARLARIEDIDHDAGDLSLGFSLSLSAAYRRGRWFLEMTQGGFDGINLGATLLAQPDWSIDFLVANIAGQIRNPDFSDDAPTTEAERDIELIRRDTLFVGSGIRATRHVGDALMQVRWISDLYSGHGHIVSARLGQAWQAGNWNIQAFIGAEYHTRRLNDYLFGVDADEATTRFPEFSGRPGSVYDAEIGATLPLGHNWVFDTRLNTRYYPEELSDSPLLIDQRDVILTSRVNYVF